MARILVVEDELPLVRLMGWLLTEAGHVVAAATSHESVAERMDVALTDILVCNSGMDSDEKRQKFAEWREADRAFESWTSDVLRTPPSPTRPSAQIRI